LYERPNRFAYKLLSGMPVADHLGSIEFRARGTDTDVTYRITSTPAIPGSATVLGALLKRTIGGVLKGIVTEAERRSGTERGRRTTPLRPTEEKEQL
jgi:hypothetical protein